MTQAITQQELSDLIRRLARGIGADLVGLAPAEIPTEAEGGPSAYQSWVEQGMHGTMEYMARNPERRRSITRWFPQAKSVVLLGFSYASSAAEGASAAGSREGYGRIARYARSEDYHEIIRDRLEALQARIMEVIPDVRAKRFVDTSAVLERLYGRYAGLGWIGKNTMLLSRRIGSYFFIAGLALDRELIYDEPAPDHCGACNRCLTACPTDAFPEPRVLDASRCIAYLTIEHRGDIPEPLRKNVGDWVFGCDVCQEVCPWNRFAPDRPSLAPSLPPRLALEYLAGLTEEKFDNDLKATPMERTGIRGLRRNALLAMGNSGKEAHRSTLERHEREEDPILAGQARWSLGRLGVLILASSLARPSWTAATALKEEDQSPPPVTSVRTPGSSHPELPSQPTIPGELKQPQTQPWFVQAIVVPQKRGMFLRLPIIDTDPNRGVTLGIMPIWVIKDENSDRITQIHAPSLTRNHFFKWNPTYRYYYYPTRDSNFEVRGSVGKFEHEVMGKFDDYNFLDKNMILGFKFQYNVDGSNRFFGIGPATPISGESNYIMDTLQYYSSFGTPIYPKSKWILLASHHLAGDNISNGPINTIPDIDAKYPGVAPFHRHQDSELRGTLQYDSRDNPITTTSGGFMELFGETAQHEIGSQYIFQHYGTDFRYFFKPDPDSRYVTAARFKGEQLLGDVPFWLLPTLGGKYSQRAYGDGRFTDHGMMTTTVEERITVQKERMGGVVTEIEVAPFAGFGTVFDRPKDIYYKWIRPAFGGAIRAVARPQVVGSIDFGIGQEGLAVFMDINYSY